MVILFTIFVKMGIRLLYKTKKLELVSPLEIDKMLIIGKHINLSNVLYERITKIPTNFIMGILIKETLFFAINLVLKLSIF